MKDIDCFIAELRDLYKIDDKRQDVATGFIKQEERELRRPISDMEAKVVLAESGLFPEMIDELTKRAIRYGDDIVGRGILLNKPGYIRNGNVLIKRAMCGFFSEREGD